MNDTILNSRQNHILKILKERGDLSRLEISRLIPTGTISNSRITLIRDLNYLKKYGLIFSKGEARSIKYYVSNINPLLEYIDLDEYFNVDFDNRNIKNDFNPNVFMDLNKLYSKEEIEVWNNASDEFIKRSKLLDKSIYKRELERFVIEFAWKSSQIEGNTYDLLETETLLIHNIEAKGHTKEEAVMIVNHKKAFDLILKKKRTFKLLKYSDVLQLHNVLTKGLITSGIRNQPVRISGTNYIPMTTRADLENAFRELINLVNNTKFPPEKALIISSVLAYIQPFSDGNKRTARTLANAILIVYDFLPLSYRNLDIDEYRKALIIFYEQNNLYHLKRITMSQIKYAVDNYFKLK